MKRLDMIRTRFGVRVCLFGSSIKLLSYPLLLEKIRTDPHKLVEPKNISVAGWRGVEWGGAQIGGVEGGGGGAPGPSP